MLEQAVVNPGGIIGRLGGKAIPFSCPFPSRASLVELITPSRKLNTCSSNWSVAETESAAQLGGADNFIQEAEHLLLELVGGGDGVRNAACQPLGEKGVAHFRSRS
jgi:hypothetical protein